MNFFGHAVVAGWFEADPRYVLGSMLPDFASMSGTRLGDVADPRVAAGVALHHRTDDAFHSAPVFLDLMAHVNASLASTDVGWGTARAVAHVGSELLLDGVYLARHATAPYVRALDVAHGLAAEQNLGAAFRDGGEGFERVLARLRDAGPPHAYRDPTRVAEFLDRALARRPRLRFQLGDRPHVIRALERLQPVVTERADELLAYLRAHELLRIDTLRDTTGP